MKNLGFVLLTMAVISIAAYTLFGLKNPSDSEMGNRAPESPDLERRDSSEKFPTVESIDDSKIHAENHTNGNSSLPSEQRPEAVSGNSKLRKLSSEEEASQVEKLYPSILNRKGFTEHEIEIIVQHQIEEIRSQKKGSESATTKASKELGLSEDKKKLLDDAFFQLYMDEIVEFSLSDVAECLSNRFKSSSDCTKSVLEDYLRDLSLALDSDAFILSQKVVDLTNAAQTKAISSCNETPERAKSQFRLVFVECDPI
jgi:hypothetical protein